MIKKIQKGKYAGQWQVRIQPIDKQTGKRISWPVQYADTKKEAISIERKMWFDFENDLQPSKLNVSFSSGLGLGQVVKLGSLSSCSFTIIILLNPSSFKAFGTYFLPVPFNGV